MLDRRNTQWPRRPGSLIVLTLTQHSEQVRTGSLPYFWHTSVPEDTPHSWHYLWTYKIHFVVSGSGVFWFLYIILALSREKLDARCISLQLWHCIFQQLPLQSPSSSCHKNVGSDIHHVISTLGWLTEAREATGEYKCGAEGGSL